MVSDNPKDRARRTRVPLASVQGSEGLLDGSDSKFTFGQHVGLSYHEVLQKFPGYYLWGKEQKSPSKGLADFLDWATDNYEVDGESHEVIPRMLPLEVASSAARSCHKKRAGLGRQKPPNPPLAKCGKCTRFTSLASNAYIQIKTCLDCGHSTRTKRAEVFLRTLKHASIRIWTTVEVASSLHVSFANSVVRLWMKYPKQKLGEDVS